MAKVISITNHKGGVGKTTSTEFLGELLAFLGKKVLLVDNDPQGNLSSMLGQRPEDNQEVVEGMESSDFMTIHELYRFKFREKERVQSVIHEVIIISTNTYSEDRDVLREMVASVNSTMLITEEILSDSVYLYDRKNSEIVML